MTERDKEELILEIGHIFDSGANHQRVYEMVEMFIDKRYVGQSLHIDIVSNSFLKEKLHELENEVARLKEFTGLDTL